MRLVHIKINYRSEGLICIVTKELTFTVYIVLVMQSLVSTQFSSLKKKNYLTVLVKVQL